MRLPRILILFSIMVGLMVSRAPQVTASQLDPAGWAPTWVHLETGQLKNDQRYVLNKMVWDDTSGLSDENATYEQDFIVRMDDASPGTYFDRTETDDGLRKPLVTLWNSDLPDPYLDTRYQDAPTDWVYTIGSADANRIEPFREYFTMIVTDPGDATFDSANLQAQLGTYSQSSPSPTDNTWIPCGILGVSNTWCSWPIGVYFFGGNNDWSIDVPGCLEFSVPDNTVTPCISANPEPAPEESNPGSGNPPVTEPTDDQPVIEPPAEPVDVIAPPAEPTEVVEPVVPEAPVVEQPAEPEATLDLDIERWCQSYYQDPNATADYLDYNDPNSWVCVTNGQQLPVSMDDAAVLAYGPGYCAYPGATAYDWKAGQCR